MKIGSVFEKKSELATFILQLFAFSLLIFSFGYTGRDDSHITYFVSDSIATGGWVVNYNGDYLEQSSTFFYSLVLALVSFVTGESSALLGPFVSGLFLFATILFSLYLAKRYCVSSLGFLAACSTVPVVYWALSGMENSVYCFLLLVFGFVAETSISREKFRYISPLVLLGALITATRPEGFIVIASIAIGISFLVVELRDKFKLYFILATSCVVGISSRLAAGLGVFPNTVYAKQDIGLQERLVNGTSYFLKTFVEMPATSLCVFGLFFLTALILKNKNFLLPSVKFSFYCMCVVLAAGFFSLLSGGDWMENGRFLVPLFLFQVMAAAAVIKKRHGKYLSLLIIVASLLDGYNVVGKPYGGLPMSAHIDYDANYFMPEFVESYNVFHLRDISFVDRFLDRLSKDGRGEIAVASVQAGMVPYYLERESSKNIKFVDLYGLTSNEVHSCLDGWEDNPYEDINSLQKCIGVNFDYIYDLDKNKWSSSLEEAGCEILFVDKVKIPAVWWKKAKTTKQFLAKCG